MPTGRLLARPRRTRRRRPGAADAPGRAAEPAEDAAAAEAVDDPQAGVSAHEESLEANGETVPDQPAEGGDAVADAATTPTRRRRGAAPPEGEGAEAEAADGQSFGRRGVAADDDPTIAIDASTGQPAAPDGSKYSGEGVYVGNEPPEGFTIKGNERSMKYHVPESSGYGRTIAEVWFNSEEAAQAAGFIRAQR